MAKTPDYVAKRVNRVTDTIGALWSQAQARRVFTEAEAKRLLKAYMELQTMLEHERILW